MLFVKECKKVLFSLTFLVYFLTVLAMYFTQFHSDNREAFERPVSGSNDYGMISKEIPEILMPAAVDSLVSEYLSGSFTAYPYGFIKYVRLTEKKKTQIAGIISEVSGITVQELNSFEGFEQGGYIMDENGSFLYQEPVIPEVNIPEDLTYEHFRELMQEADRIIGGGSKYSDDYIVGNFSRVPQTYEDALAEYEQFLNEDKITGAYARLYCDYLGIVLAVLPVFVAAALANLDRKSRMEQLAYSRKISSTKLIFTRFIALVAVMMIPVILTAIIANNMVNSLYPDDVLDCFAIFRYALFWLVPNIMTASAVGMLVAEFSSGLLAIFVQGAWWFTSVFSSAGRLTGGIGKFTLDMRHNSLTGHGVFFAQWENIVFNRVFYTVISLLGIALTAFIYEQKRRGIFNGLQLRINRQSFKRQPKA